MNRDFAEMLSTLNAHGAEYLIVGAHALAVHGHPRATGDIDIWVRPTPVNAAKVWRALARFGAPMRDLTVEDLSRPGVVFQIGVPPCRVDILTQIDGVTFDVAWSRRVETKIGDLTIAALGRADLIANKRAAGRPKDRADLAWLEAADHGPASDKPS
jgi:hypothetical protein